MNIRLLAVFAFLGCANSILAQRNVIVDSGWETMKDNAAIPVCAFRTQLVNDWADSVYQADIEYPELEKIDESLLEKWNLAASDIPQWPLVSTRLTQSCGQTGLEAEFLPFIQRNGGIYAIRSYKAVLNAQPSAQGTSGKALPAGERYAAQSVLTKGKWARIRIQETGVYKLSYSYLKKMGFSDPSKVRLYGYGGAVLPETNIHDLSDDLPQQPLWQGNGYVLFYAQGPVSWKYDTRKGYVHEVNTYSDYGYYFLSDCEPDTRNAFGEIEADTIVGSIISSYPDFAVYDPDEYSWYRSGRRMFEKYDYSGGNSRSYQFNVAGMETDSVGVAVAFSASSSRSTSVSVAVNGASIGKFNVRMQYTNEVAAVSEANFIAREKFKEQNTVTITHDRTSGVSGHLDYIRLNYRRRLAMYGAYTLFRVDKARKAVSFRISESAPSVQVWKLSENGVAGIVPSEYVDGCTVTMASDYDPNDIILAVNPDGTFPEPVFAGQVENQNLHGLENVDMVIVVPASGKYTTQAERLAKAHREMDSLNTVVVRTDQIFNEFSSGTPDATAIRRFMKMLYDRGGTGNAPRYLLLMGPGAWDNRMHGTDWKGRNPDDYILCYESQESLSHTDSYVMEEYYGLLDDSEGKNPVMEMTDLGIGRLPFETVDQMRSKVSQIIEYMSGTNMGAWTNRILVLGDDGDNNTHMEDADKVAQVYQNTSPATDVRKVYWDAFNMEVTASYNSYPSIRKLLLEQLNDGALIVNYSGHGSTEVLSHELVLDKQDMKSLSSERLPFWITASCDIAPFDSPEESLGMNLLANAQGGAIGMLATTRTVHSGPNGAMNRSFSRYVMTKTENGRTNTLGDALRLAKNELVTSGTGESDFTVNKLNFVLLGDPAMRLMTAQVELVVDSIQGWNVSGVAMAGSVMNVSGHVEINGDTLDNYNGIFWATVYDSERTITCLNNLSTADEPFVFKYRDRVLFSGSDSVYGGRFCFSFPVPMDINYSNDNGDIILMAVSRDGISGNGCYADFKVGGTASGLGTDTIGPEIRLMLNDNRFRYGGSVNCTPTLIVELSDSSGLNTSGNGLGHDILLVIDNNPNWTWVLNSSFVQNQGDYTRGLVTFSIPELPEGEHELMFRAWDVMNNSTTVYTRFVAVNDLKPNVEISVTESSASGHVVFAVSHNRPAQNAGVALQVCDSFGKVLWTASTTDKSSSGMTQISWSRNSSGGQRARQGLYVVTATVGTQGGRQESVSLKFVLVDP